MLVPYDVILLDEVTALLDVLCRTDLLAFLRRESEERSCTVIIATHVFDGLDGWPTHLCYLQAYPVAGSVGYFGPVPEEARVGMHGLYSLVEKWLRNEQRQAKEKGQYHVELEAGPDAAASRTSLASPQNRAGGYAPGRGSAFAATSRAINMYN